MEISLILDNFYPKIGGMSIQNQEMARFLHRSGNTIRVFPLLGDSKFDYATLPYPIEPIYITRTFPENYGQLNLHSIYREILKTVKGLSKIGKIGKCSIIHTDLYTSGLLGSLVKKMKKKHLFINFGGNIFRNEEFSGKGEDKYHKYKGLFYTAGARIALSVADKIIVNGEDIAFELISHGIPAEKIKVIYIGVDETVFRPEVGTRDLKRYLSENNVSIPKGRPVVMFCGRLVNATGPFDFLEVVNDLEREVTGIIVGKGPLKKELEEKAKKGRNTIVFTGSVEHNSMPQLLRLADLCVYPFVKIGGISQVVLEAMACERCVVTTNAGAVGKVIENGHNGFMSNVGDTKKMTYYANMILGDHRLRSRVSKKARQDILARWSWARKIEEYLGVCEEVLCEN